ncbi:hypothetical protein [Sulfuritalea sp.]|jgi:hypothetical protein|uniref:hypothetical protein n=1 Tax=Sulfuritalea sp. TaxID=2480090 RepID=UPI001AD4B29B|nr:hypothetical protein [Sulfuritalea sp.]MBN8473310.1 hypothetical protein [Sulfuritalea sp.]
MHAAHSLHQSFIISTILGDHAHIRELIGASSRSNCRDVALLAAAEAAELHEMSEPGWFSVLGLGRPPTRCETSAQDALAAMTEFQNARHSAGSDHVDALAQECQEMVLDHLHGEERWLRYAMDWADVIEPEAASAATAAAMTEERFLADSGWPTSNRFDYGTLEWRAAVADHEILRAVVRKTYDGIHIHVDRAVQSPGAEGVGTVRRNILSAFANRDEPGTLRFTVSRLDTQPCNLRPADALQIITSLTRGMGPVSFRTHGTASARSALAPTGIGRSRHEEFFGPRV